MEVEVDLDAAVQSAIAAASAAIAAATAATANTTTAAPAAAAPEPAAAAAKPSAAATQPAEVDPKPAQQPTFAGQASGAAKPSGSGQGRAYRGHLQRDVNMGEEFELRRLEQPDSSVESGEEGEAGEEGATWDDAMDDAHDRPESYYSRDDTALTNPAAVPQHDISLSQAVDVGLLPPRYLSALMCCPPQISGERSHSR